MNKLRLNTFTHLPLVGLIGLSILSACKKREMPLPNPSKVSLATSGISNDVNPFRDVPKLTQASTGMKFGNGQSENIFSNNTADGCSVRQVTVDAGFDEQLLLAPGSDIIYLGSVIDANSLSNGTYRPIVPIQKRPVTMSVSLQGVSGRVLRKVDATLSGTRQALAEIINQNITGEQPGEVAYTVNQIFSEDQLKIAVGASFSYSKLGDIKASFNFNSLDQKTRIVAKFLQKYYTVDMDIPADGVFVDERPDPAKFGPYSPVYISSLTYGRMGLFFMESNYSMKEVSSALEATFKYLMYSGSVNVSTSTKEILNSSTIKVYTTGGSGSEAVQSISGYEGFVQFIKSGGRFSQNSRGAILSYQLRNVSDWTLFQVHLTSTYQVKSCEARAAVYRFRHKTTGEHHYIVKDQEAIDLRKSSDWNYEGISFYTANMQLPYTIPVHRFYNQSSTDHCLVSTTAELNQLRGYRDWRYQDVGFYAYTTPNVGLVPVYRLYNKVFKDHIYTTNATEANDLLTRNLWWISEGTPFYAYAAN